MQVPVVKALWCGARAAYDCRLSTQAARLHRQVVEGSKSRSARTASEQPELHCQQWLRNVKGADSAMGTCCTTLGGHHSGTKRSWRGGEGSSLAAMHHLPTKHPAIAASTRATGE